MSSSTSSIATATRKRLMKELGDINKSTDCIANNIKLGLKSEDNLMSWKATITGPSDTPYAGGVFSLEINIPPDYPFKPPSIKFLQGETKVYHPNVSENSGDICVDILKSNWSPALTLEKTMLSIVALLQNPNADDPLNSSAASLYKSDKNGFAKKVKEYIANGKK